MYRWFIALKYLTSRFITFAALLIVSSAVALLIVILSVMEGFRTDLKDRIRGTSADIRVESKGFIGLKDPQGLSERVRKVDGVRAVSPFIETLAMYQREGDSESDYFALQAVDLAEDSRVRGIEEYLMGARRRGEKGENGEPSRSPYESRFLRVLGKQPATPEGILSEKWLSEDLWKLSGEERPPPDVRPVLVGYELKKAPFWFLPGRTLKLTSYSPVTSRAHSREFFVAGVFLSRDYQFDSRTILLPRLSDAEDFLDLRDPATGAASFSGLRVAVAPGESPDEVSERIRKAASDVPFLRVRTWQEEKRSLLRAVGIEKTVVGIILGVLILFAGFMIFIVLTVQVVEKTRDLGILQSLGSTSFGIAGIYFMIGAGVCLLGTLLGTFLGVAFSLSVNTIQRWIYLLVGFDLFPKDVYYIDRIPVRLAPVDLLFIIAPTVLASLLASVIPALRAARKDPVVALRYE